MREIERVQTEQEEKEGKTSEINDGGSNGL